MKKWMFAGLLACLVECRRTEANVFHFCRDFEQGLCKEPFAETAGFRLPKARRNSTMRDYWNSVYFLGDRLAFEIVHADARRAVSFECLRGYYHFGDNASDRHEIEYIELREKNVYGLVMLGSLIEKKFTPERNRAYHAPVPFNVTYSVYCSNDLLARAEIQVRVD